MRELNLHKAPAPFLDVGGFDGYWTSQVLAGPGFVIDTDVQPQHAAAFIRGSGEALPFPDCAFATVYAFDVIEHVDNDIELMREALRVLRPGGQLLLTTPNANVRIFPAALQPWVNRKWGHTRVPGYAPAELERLALGAGASEATATPLARRAVHNGYLALRLIWTISETAGRRLGEAMARWDHRHLVGEHGSVLLRATR